MASYLDARVHEGRWLLRIEDIDFARSVPGADRVIMQQLLALGMQWDGEPTWQSQRLGRYQLAFESLCARNLAYGCACTRQELPPEGPYPGTCRNGLPPGRHARSWRFRTRPGIQHFTDRWQGPQQQDAQEKTGDFIIRRADGYWAYQLAVVVDDGEQGVTDIVRGADLLELTACQRMLARSLGHPCPRVMHVPLLCDEQGRKLSKQNHASALDLSQTVRTLNQAWRALGFKTLDECDAEGFWRAARIAWARRYPIG